MKPNFLILLIALLLTSCSPSFTPTRKLDIRLINKQFDGQQVYSYVVINQVFNATSEMPVEVVLDRKKDQAEALLVCNHLETHSGGLSQNLKVFQIQLFKPKHLRFTREHFTWLPADYALPELLITRTQ